MRPRHQAVYDPEYLEAVDALHVVELAAAEDEVRYQRRQLRSAELARDIIRQERVVELARRAEATSRGRNYGVAFEATQAASRALRVLLDRRIKLWEAEGGAMQRLPEVPPMERIAAARRNVEAVLKRLQEIA